MKPSMYKTTLTGITIASLVIMVIAGVNKDPDGWTMPLAIVAAGSMIARAILERPA